MKKVKFQKNSLINMNIVSQISKISKNDENPKSVNYLLHLDRIPLETTKKTLQPFGIPIESINNAPSNIKDDKIYI